MKSPFLQSVKFVSSFSLAVSMLFRTFAPCGDKCKNDYELRLTFARSDLQSDRTEYQHLQCEKRFEAD